MNIKVVVNVKEDLGPHKFVTDENGLTWKRVGDYWTLSCQDLDIAGWLGEYYIGSIGDPPHKDITITDDRALKYLDHVRTQCQTT